MREAVKAERPGIVSADRPREGPFADLVSRIAHDSSALDGFTFAYSELGTEGRRGLIRAVVQDIPDPGGALGALLAVESDAALAADLAGLLRRHGQTQGYATLKRRQSGGEACLIRPGLGFAYELLRIAWNDNEIELIEVESGLEMNLVAAEDRASVSATVELVAPFLWHHIRRDGALPDGVERFAGFFSVT